MCCKAGFVDQVPGTALAAVPDLRGYRRAQTSLRRSWRRIVVGLIGLASAWLSAACTAMPSTRREISDRGCFTVVAGF